MHKKNSHNEPIKNGIATFYCCEHVMRVYLLVGSLFVWLAGWLAWVAVCALQIIHFCFYYYLKYGFAVSLAFLAAFYMNFFVVLHYILLFVARGARRRKQESETCRLHVRALCALLDAQNVCANTMRGLSSSLDGLSSQIIFRFLFFLFLGDLCVWRVYYFAFLYCFRRDTSFMQPIWKQFELKTKLVRTMDADGMQLKWDFLFLVQAS